jgi:hypothetical protein
MHFACILMLALAQGQFGKDTNGAEPTSHDKPAVTEPESRADTPAATSSNTSDKAESLSPTHQTELQGGPAKKTTAKSAKKARKSAKSMPEATPPSTPGNGIERNDTATPGKKSPKQKEPNMQNEDRNPDNKSPDGQR